MKLALLPALLGVAVASCGGEPRASVLLVTLDTTRADAIGCYGAQPALTPHLDALAAEGTTYLWARTVTPITLPAHASMLTGLYPNRHTVRDNALNALPQTALCIAERAASAGAATGAFVSAKVLDRAFGLDQGFATYSQPSRDAEVLSNTTFSSRPARETAAEAITWLRALDAGEPFFAWVHFFDAHAPWSAEPRWVAAAGGNPYLAEVAAQDDALGSLLAALRDLGRYESTTILVVGDHGEGLGEHGEASHASFVFDTTMRVPFVLRRADGARRGERSEELVSVADVHPTLCDALSLPAAPGLDGVSLWSAPLASERGVYFESYYAHLHYGMAPIAGWADRRAKYVHSSEAELYDPLRHPKERRNLLGELDVPLEPYRARIAEQQARPALQGSSQNAVDPGLQRAIAALGYATGGTGAGALPTALEPTDRPFPHSRAEELQRCDAAHELFLRERWSDAAQLLQTVLEGNPRNTFALEFLGLSELRLGNDAAARTAIERALELGPERASLLSSLGFLQERQGESEAAQRSWLRAHELDPSDQDVLRQLLRAAVRTQDAEAEQRWRAALRDAESR